MKGIFIKKSISNLLNETQKQLKKASSQRIQIGVTGLSGSGKSTFVTSLITQLLTANSVAKLPFVELINENRWLGAKLSNHENGEYMRFPYEESVHNLQQLDSWPNPTTRESRIVLELTYIAKSSIWSKFWPERTLEIELIDYPGEWLSDIPLLDLDYFAWSAEISTNLKPFRDFDEAKVFKKKILSLHKAIQSGKDEPVSENSIKYLQVVEAYKSWLRAIHDNTNQYVILQPGRFLSPGHLENTPLLNFFPWDLNQFPLNEECSIIPLLKNRFRTYQKKVITPFLTDFFSGCSRQVILVDLVNAVNGGKEEVNKLQQILKNVFKIHDYGTNNWLRRLINPNIEKILVATSKADLLPPDQHRKMQLLLSSLLTNEIDTLKQKGCSYNALAISSIRATENRVISENGHDIQAVCGRLEQVADDQENWVTVIPADFPESVKLLEVKNGHGLQNLKFSPPQNWRLGKDALPHIRMDQVIDFLVGDLMG